MLSRPLTPDAADILDKIDAFCREKGFSARGNYGRSVIATESDWYEIALPSLDQTEPHCDPRFEHGERNDVYAICAYKNRGRPLILGWHKRVPPIVSEHFRDTCLRNGISDVEFCWARDVGRYDSEQYFFMYPSQALPRIACDADLHYSDKNSSSYPPRKEASNISNRLAALGGFPVRLFEIFYDLKFLLTTHYPASDMPKSGFAYAYYDDRCGRFTCDNLLVHKDTTQILIKEKLISPNDLIPVPMYDDLPPAYVERKLHKIEIPPKAHFAEMQVEYEAIKKSNRPRHKATEKQAVQILRSAKYQRKSDFPKRMSKDLSESISGTPYSPLLPYYLVADGGCLSDEYRLLPYSAALEQTAEFFAELEKEDLPEEKPDGIVFAACADGDFVILERSGTVIRFSHECPEILDTWPTLAQFFADNTEAEIC